MERHPTPRPLMQSLARYRSERSQPRAAEAVAIGGYRGHALLLERWVGIVLWLALIAVLVVESG